MITRRCCFCPKRDCCLHKECIWIWICVFHSGSFLSRRSECRQGDKAMRRRPNFPTRTSQHRHMRAHKRKISATPLLLMSWLSKRLWNHRFEVCPRSVCFLCRLWFVLCTKLNMWQQHNSQSVAVNSFKPPAESIYELKSLFSQGEKRGGFKPFIAKISLVWTWKGKGGSQNKSDGVSGQTPPPQKNLFFTFMFFFFGIFSYFYTSAQWIIKTDDEYYD